MRSLTICLSMFIAFFANAEQALTIEQLLEEVKQLSSSERKIDQQRLQTFLAAEASQDKLLKQATERLKAAEALQDQLKNTYDNNEAKLTEQAELLKSRTGQMGEVFGVIKQQTQDLSGLLRDSLTTTELPNRLQQLEFADQKRIPTLEELENLWFVMQQEMTASGQVKKVQVKVAGTDGQVSTLPVMRLGVFNAITEQGRYLGYDPIKGSYSVLARQPSNEIISKAQAFYQGSSNELVVDPGRGSILNLMGRTPTLTERIQQGGIIGAIILVLGLLGLMMAVFRLILTFASESAVRSQLKKGTSKISNNAMGRILKASQATDSTESLELRVDEALMAETPKLEFGLTFIKLLAAVAPLLGLLGTVTGMIGTFQSITVFGTSDPKMMAGGISQALMTTVLGLVVAIPLLFMHSLAATRSKRTLQLLQQKTLAILAQNSEATGKQKA